MRWLTQLFGTETHRPETTQHDLHRAAAALLLEVARTDGNVDDEESRHLIDTVQSRWHLDPGEMQDILGELEARLDQATDLFEFTAPLREHWDPETRVALIEDMWSMAAIDGKADVAYIPGKTIIGLSKINRIVRFFAQRPQVQERLNQQVLVALQTLLGTEDVAVKINATHYCVKARGVMDSTSSTETLSLGGQFLADRDLRRDFVR